ncbi:DUF1294 domain-containing protein [Chryseobacterium sp. Bi04]|uniref:DUF1294 domain-containing protein n=1 Tax=Chryseobacterium sp. Bi04 TaxID=2822345 RepID=UPI001D7EC904|nr:DUF1294 domain-containing protein [Chryseobacterium sp. Bi04]CAH0170930.1 hypothetical protein SRABI04_01249 [Chryseobacterium sp. Bi04]
MKIIICLLIVNVVTFCVFGFDKLKAKKNQRRISENTLLGLSLVGGIIIFNHKTSKKSFLMKFILVVLVDLVLLYRFVRH